ncbi:MAG: hypothetical protein NC344_10320 [Bacteroidales bacterium]|nr:hypothetical protein [Bacteroidales bacterium]MCM1148199.1 hypothetical protein [Bacteroidales bacterium]MCM1207074.1 hypothetical protein [Bacillota bacterium]MCM1510818.1 hypothetical protein [Clostridium sp.]
MKKIHILLALTLCICLCGCFSFNPKNNSEGLDSEEVVDDPQDDAATAKNTHLKFKGVPIDGALETFVTRMKHKGFKYEGSTEDGYEVLTGEFAGSKNCSIYVATLDNQDLVSRIYVKFPERERWEYLYGEYEELKKMLTEKYGKPSSCTEKFLTFSTKTDSDKMRAVDFGECKYESCFNVNNGEIVLWIEHEGFSTCYVMLLYKDKANTTTVRRHAKDDL